MVGFEESIQLSAFGHATGMATLLEVLLNKTGKHSNNAELSLLTADR
ncbi:MAG: hypothetical protein F6J90_31110 [Moorea sp. SIOASIH]|nr:hypothetical protein [Moorena sp. SIOASIH]